MLFLVSNRRNLYLGSERDVDTQAFAEALVVGEASSGQEFIYSSGLMLSAEQLDHFYWGQRYFTLLFVRPIPTLIWPTKYEDLGLGWMVNEPGTAGLSDMVWLRAVGFMPLRGSAGGFIADAFLEFWWFGVIVCYLIGRLYGYCWTRSDAHRTDLDRNLRGVARIERLPACAERGGVALPRAAVDRTDVDSLGARRWANVAPHCPSPSQ